MLSFFIVKIEVERARKNGIIQKVTEEYLFDAYTYTEVERRAAIAFEGDKFSVDTISKKAKVEKAIAGYGEIWFEARVQYDLEDEKVRKEVVYVQAYEISEVVGDLKAAYLKDCIWPWTITSIKQTSILEYHAAKNVQLPLFGGNGNVTGVTLEAGSKSVTLTPETFDKAS